MARRTVCWPPACAATTARSASCLPPRGTGTSWSSSSPWASWWLVPMPNPNTWPGRENRAEQVFHRNNFSWAGPLHRQMLTDRTLLINLWGCISRPEFSSSVLMLTRVPHFSLIRQLVLTLLSPQWCHQPQTSSLLFLPLLSSILLWIFKGWDCACSLFIARWVLITSFVIQSFWSSTLLGNMPFFLLLPSCL